MFKAGSDEKQMKYLSLIVFALGLSWTWNIIHSRAEVPLQTHYIIQSKLREILAEAISKQKPNATQLTINSLWTESLKKDRIKAHLEYSFAEPSESGSVKTRISAYVILQKNSPEVTEADGLETWALSEVKATNDAVIFEEGLLVTPGDEPAPPESLAPPAEGSSN
jgi:hypothetical protein